RRHQLREAFGEGGRAGAIRPCRRGAAQATALCKQGLPAPAKILAASLRDAAEAGERLGRGQAGEAPDQSFKFPIAVWKTSGASRRKARLESGTAFPGITAPVAHRTAQSALDESGQTFRHGSHRADADRGRKNSRGNPERTKENRTGC